MVKPTILFLLILGISGYLFLDGLSSHHFKLKRTNGYHTFFKSTAYGLIIFIAASIVHVVIQWLGSVLNIGFDLGNWMLSNSIIEKPNSSETAFLNISLISLLFGFFAPKIHNLFLSYNIYGVILNKLILHNRIRNLCVKHREIMNKLKIHKENELRYEFLSDVESPEFSRLIKKASELSLPILFTMSDRKVYVGYPWEITGGALINDLLVVPLVSGYRCKETNRLYIITRYIDVVQKIKEQEELEFKEFLKKDGKYTDKDIDLMFEQYPLSRIEAQVEDIEEFLPYTVSLPYREIVHAHIHNLDQFELFKNDEINERENN
ncbi:MULTISPECIES: hypothetical protein [Vibrio]|nr:MULTISPECIES: hypothetical protein [Vibrio]KFJ87946.1 hypothetical protein IJ23_09090 [Vibrio sp. OY15]MBS9911262.1 hypothetical protein [Vibrio alginolyticus]MBT0049098.1 hypothetical protein [Vibrio alginolyticus]